jgi:DNA repair protein RadA/Sms
MVRERARFVCQECGAEFAKWAGRCPECGTWNSIVEAEPLISSRGRKVELGKAAGTVRLRDVSAEDGERISTGFGELDRVLGGGIVPGSLILFGGDPGIGKSTLLLQVAERISRRYGACLYVSGEESARQIKLRADRIGVDGDRIELLCETDLSLVMAHIRREGPRLVVVDSIQTVYLPDIPSAPGSIAQVRECTGELMGMAKETGIPVMLVGHVTKEGIIAGPKMLEHMVDTVLYFEGERVSEFRILRSVKNRFGSTNEVGIFEMREGGLVEVENPSSFFLSGRAGDVPGSVVSASMGGTRPLLIEVQALVGPSVMGVPQRMVTGISPNRLSLLLAVLERRIGMRLQYKDVFVNVVGGIRVEETAVDLGVAVAISSSLKDKAIDPEILVFGEVGLGGEVRAVDHAGQRVREGVKLGFKRCVIPEGNARSVRLEEGVEVIGVKTVKEAIDILI